MTILNERLEIELEIDEIIKIKNYIEDKNIDKLMERIDVLEYFLIKYGYLIDKDDITRLMREVKKTDTPNKYDYF